MNDDNDTLPWRQFMEISFGILKLTPEAFWQMTPPEWLAAMKGWDSQHYSDQLPPIQRDDLLELMQHFPDSSQEK